MIIAVPNGQTKLYAYISIRKSSFIELAESSYEISLLREGMTQSCKECIGHFLFIWSKKKAALQGYGLGSLGSLYTLTVGPDLNVNYVDAITIMVASRVHQEIDDVSGVHVQPPFYLLSIGATFRIGVVTSFQ